ncbi:MAG: hypothetical protein FWE46_03755 [Coriobacteriia bacterium]|nr:hypothetical protein [Coriobacteriia bacterium]
MNANQQQFYDYVTSIAQEDKLDDLKAILAENFRRQDDGSMTKEYMMESGPKLIDTLKPEFREQFTQTMTTFLADHVEV